MTDWIIIGIFVGVVLIRFAIRLIRKNRDKKRGK